MLTHTEDKSINAFYGENLRRRWKDDIKLDHTKIISQTLHLINLRDFRLPPQCN